MFFYKIYEVSPDGLLKLPKDICKYDQFNSEEEVKKKLDQPEFEYGEYVVVRVYRP